MAAAVGFLMLLVYMGRWLTFWFDEWSFILDRPDPSVDSILQPHVDHLVAVPVLIYQGLLRVFGLGSYWPYVAVLWACHIVSVGLLYRITSRSAGPWIGWIAAISLLTLGCAFEDLLQAFQITFLLSTVFGLSAVERLQASDVPRTRDAIAAGLGLVVATASSGIGAIFLGLVLAWGILSRNRERILAAIPALIIYAGWYAVWGRAGAGPIEGTSGDPLAPVLSLAYGLGASVSGVVGLAPYIYAPLGLVIGLLAAMRLGLHGLGPSALGWAALLALIAQYGLQAIFRSGMGIEHAARSGYLYPAAIFLWLTLSDVIGPEGPRNLSRYSRGLVVIAVVLAVAGNLTQLIGAGRATLGLRANELAELRLIETVRAIPGLAMDQSPDEELIPQVTPRRYLAAVDRFGEPRLAIESSTQSIADLADPARLNSAALRLLAGAFLRGSHNSPERPEDFTAMSGDVRPQGPACFAVSGLGQILARWRVGAGDGFSIAPPPRTLRLGIKPTFPAPAPSDVWVDTINGRVVLPPRLPDGESWFAEVESQEHVVICRMSTT